MISPTIYMAERVQVEKILKEESLRKIIRLRDRLNEVDG